MHCARPGSADALVGCAFRLVCRCGEIGESKYDEARTEKRHEGRLTPRHSNSKVMRIAFFVGINHLFRTLLDSRWCSNGQRVVYWEQSMARDCHLTARQ